MSRRGLARRGLAATIVTIIAIGAVLAAAVMSSTAGAQSRGTGGPTYEPNFAGDVAAPRPCALDTRDKRERALYAQEGWKGPDYERYPGSCQRMKFAYGPLAIKPGQNDVLVGPVTIEKPSRDGFITRLRPNLVRADGSVPPVEQIHLHHGTWLSQPEYGTGPFFASGEEKTVAPFPRGYGMPIKATDTWELLYMVHSAVPEPMEVFITYEVDFIPKADAAKWKIKPAYPVWLDVRPAGYPVFNVQRRFGGRDQKCTWPTEKCADFDPFGKKFIGQGEPGNGRGEDYRLPKRGESLGQVKNFTGGTLVGIGGHLHPGGLTNEVDLVRPGGEQVTRRVPYKVNVKSKDGKKTRTVTRYRTVTTRVDKTRIYTGRAHYWGRKDPSKSGGPPTSWDFSMEVSGMPDWAVHVKPGDILRSNATYDTKHQATYENMGIVVALLAPDTPAGKKTAPGLNPFHAPRDNSRDCASGGIRKGTLCDAGFITHGHFEENGNYGGPKGHWNIPTGGQANNVAIADFIYTPGDLSNSQTLGIPKVKLGTKLTFTNAEGPLIYHTVTSCAWPCLGPTGAAFPLANGKTSKGRSLDLDSSELGYGAPYIGPTAQTIRWQLPVTKGSGFTPGEKVTYFCRIHPFMRGAFEVSK